jgi:hypothetical protein
MRGMSPRLYNHVQEDRGVEELNLLMWEDQ